MWKLPRCLTALLVLAPLAVMPSAAGAQARFDLAGPQIDLRVTRGTMTLPIARVPNLQPGDQVWVHPDFPATQSAHYLLIVAFLRGTTNPPPDSWFTRVETWDKKVREEGVTVTVPADAQQAILFLAPETGGDFSTLRSAVKGRPGIFVRASQDLAEAGFEQARIEKYLESMKRVPPSDAAAIAEHSNLLARTLNLRPNPDCFKRPLDQQYTCLTQTGSQALLDDGHAQSIVATLSTGAGSDFINQASTTRLAAGGNYSAYVGALVDLARILNGLHVAQYQYIPALALPGQAATPEALSLRLNTAPSFNNPKSVIVIGLPAVAAVTLPPLRPAEPDHVSCLADEKMVLPIEGAPLVFTTGYAHGLVLHLQSSATGLPLAPDAYQGGLTFAPAAPDRHELADVPAAVAVPGIAAAKSAAPAPGGVQMGTIEGMWGFDRFTGPTLPVQQTPGVGWRIVSPGTTLIAGQPNHLELMATGTACIREISLEPGQSPVGWKLEKKPAGQDEPVDLTLNLQHAATPGSIQLAIAQYGAKEPEHLGTKTFSEPAKIAGLQVHQGDRGAVLSGTSLDQVKSVNVKESAYAPAGTAAGSTLRLDLAADAKAPGFKAGEHLQAQVRLNDGRALDVATVVLPPRPEVTLLSRRVVQPAPSPIQLSTPDDLPLGAQLMFFLKSAAAFPRAGQIEIASAPAAGSDDVLKTSLTVAAGSLVLQDAHTLLATFDPLKTFGPSTFGPFRLRALAPDGAGGFTEGEWIPLATIVRLPTLTALHCPANVTLDCTLSGQGLYLLDAVAADLAFTRETKVPEGFVEPGLQMPRPVGGVFYLRLRDDMATTHQVTLPVVVDPGPARTALRFRSGAGLTHGE